MACSPPLLPRAARAMAWLGCVSAFVVVCYLLPSAQSAPCSPVLLGDETAADYGTPFFTGSDDFLFIFGHFTTPSPINPYAYLQFQYLVPDQIQQGFNVPNNLRFSIYTYATTPLLVAQSTIVPILNVPGAQTLFATFIPGAVPLVAATNYFLGIWNQYNHSVYVDINDALDDSQAVLNYNAASLGFPNPFPNSTFSGANVPRSIDASPFYYALSVQACGSAVRGDPQFVGLLGQSYQVHGIDGAVYNLITHEQLQVNARFVFLSDGECPVVKGVRGSNCWSHKGSYLGSVGLKVRDAGGIQRVELIAGSHLDGFHGVLVNGEPVAVDSQLVLDGVTVEFSHSHQVRVTTELFAFTFDNSDLFINQEVRPLVPVHTLTTHGLLGQTHSPRRGRGAARIIEGEVDDFVIADNDLFGSSFIHNQFL